jgi:hypothetical protein
METHTHQIRLDMHWICTGYALDMHWICTGYALDMHWICTGYALDMHWICTGSALDMHWICTGYALDMRWICTDPKRREPNHRTTKRWIQHHTVPGWSPTPVLSGLKPR